MCVLMICVPFFFCQNFAAQFDGGKGSDPGPGPMVRPQIQEGECDHELTPN